MQVQLDLYLANLKQWMVIVDVYYDKYYRYKLGIETFVWNNPEAGDRLSSSDKDLLTLFYKKQTL